MESNKWEKMKKVFSYSNIAVAVGLLAILISIIFFTKSRLVRKPIYAVSEPEAIAKLIKEYDRMTILWDDEPVENAILVRVAIWNSGRRYIDILDISKTNPIRIIPSEDVKILSIEEIETSRPELQFETFIETFPKTQNQYVRIQIIGDEALERNDGGLFKIVYSGSIDCDFEVKGRIKGSSSGFSRKSWHSVSRMKSGPLRSASFIILVIYTFLTIFYFLLAIKRVRQKRYKFTGIFIIGSIILFMIILFMANIYIYLRFFSYLWAPGWID